MSKISTFSRPPALTVSRKVELFPPWFWSSDLINCCNSSNGAKPLRFFKSMKLLFFNETPRQGARKSSVYNFVVNDVYSLVRCIKSSKFLEIKMFHGLFYRDEENCRKIMLTNQRLSTNDLFAALYRVFLNYSLESGLQTEKKFIHKKKYIKSCYWKLDPLERYKSVEFSWLIKKRLHIFRMDLILVTRHNVGRSAGMHDTYASRIPS